MTAQIIQFPRKATQPDNEMRAFTLEVERLRATPKWRKAFAGPDTEYEREILRKAREAIAKLPMREGP